jgi:RNA polymerase sigma-70 factor (ECF subfamily)
MSSALDESAFAALVERHRAELQVHCYRMLGSYEESEDLVQETFLRAWRSRARFRPAAGRSAVRPWLYRIATNACLDVLRSRPRRVTPPEVTAATADPAAPPSPPADLPWLQPFPDRLLEPVAPAEEDPAALAVSRETLELAFVAAIQHLSPRQRAVLILRDVVGSSAKETAAMLEATVAGVNSLLQRARATLRDHLPERRTEWTHSTSDEERALLRRYLDAHERADVAAFAALLREDARLTMPPHPTWFDGREAIVVAAAQGFDPQFGRLRSIAVAANHQPAAAHFVLAPGASQYVPLAIDVLRIEGGLIAEISSFVYPELFPAFVPRDEFPADAR